MSGIGWIKIHRKILGDPIFQNEKLFKVWMYCLLKATHRDYEQLVGLQIIPLKPGEFIFGRNAAAKELNMNPSTVWKHVKVLQKLGNIDIKSNNKFSVINVVKWSDYQNVNDEKEQQSNNKVTTKEQQSNTNKNIKNNKNNKIDYSEPVDNFISAYNVLAGTDIKKSSNIINLFNEISKSHGEGIFTDAITQLGFSKYLKNGKDIVWFMKNIENVVNGNYKDKPATKFHNFEGQTSQYSDDELNAIALRRNKK